MRLLLLCWFLQLFSFGELDENGGYFDQPINCTETSTKSYDYCLVESNMCQAVMYQPLVLKCYPCEDNDLVYWTLWDNSTFQSSMILKLNSSMTGSGSSGCMFCQCGQRGASFSVQVQPAAFPVFAVPVDNGSFPVVYHFKPPVATVKLALDSEGTYCVNCTALGYPNVTYSWTYSEDGGDLKNITDDASLWSPPGSPEVLCQTPTIANVQVSRTFQCSASNFAGTIKGQQTVEFPDEAPYSSWFVRPHQRQSNEMILGGVNGASGYCAAYQQEDISFIYYVCNVSQDVDTSMVAGLFDQDKLNCCECGQMFEPCELGETVKLSMVKVTDYIGLPTMSCRADLAPNSSLNLACLVKKNLSSFGRGYSISAPQMLGKFWVEPVLNYTVTPPIPKWVVETLIAMLVCTFVLFVCASSLVVYYRRRYKCVFKKNLGHLQDVVEGGPDALAVGDQQQQEEQEEQEQQQQQQKQEESDEGTTEGLSNHQRPFSLHLSLTSGGTSASGETQPLLSTCSIENYYSINGVLDQASEQQYKGLKGRVRSRHQQFINTLLIDGQLLAALHEKELLSELQRQELHARIDRNDAPMRTSNYFVGSVVFQWPSSVFDRNLRELSKALAEHSDAGNKYLGKMFEQILTFPSPD